MSIKMIVDRVVLWSIKNHWMFLIVLVGLQYLTGKTMSEWGIPAGISPTLVLKLHKFNGSFIALLALLLVLEKGYLWLKKTGRV